MRLPLLALLALLPATAFAADGDGGGDGCTIEAGPDDLVAQDRDLVIPAGAEVKDAVALRGNVVVERGARVEKVVAAGGSLTVKGGAVVRGDAVAIGGDLRVEPEGRVEGNAVAIGGQVKLAAGSTVKGDVTSISLQLGGTTLARAVLAGIGAVGPCRVVAERKDEATRR